MPTLTTTSAEVAVARIMATGEVDASIAAWIAQACELGRSVPPAAVGKSAESAWAARALEAVRCLPAIEQARRAPVMDVLLP